MSVFNVNLSASGGSAGQRVVMDIHGEHQHHGEVANS